MKLLFAHGWGFDHRFWEPLAALLPEWAHVSYDRGYFGASHEPAVEGPCLAVTHSFGTMRILAAPPPGLTGIVAINGFERFSALPGRPGVPVRVLDRMLRRFETDPRGVLAEFRKTCGSTEAFGEIDPAALAADLLRLRDAAPSLPDVPILAIHGGADPLLPPEMRAATFTGAQVRRIDHEAGGHLLPLQAPQLCAAAIRGMLA
ncbi:alpha/beta hydrolase [Novosphingobium resinovorum]|uniref:alpha/beta fold hydrolase n=1 Tax=Novosphingobium TaxID=165696 RepID=UPI001B3CA211|nr:MULTISPECIES: alpha/beta hydrolase [Novosphingobium]MBF7010296.1 alpha/beta hydrolase [Novosphingobium sp. HR1a]WJM28304.1 alpha/beta hydrolase [Novosphingobium resinovorum]